MQQDILQKTFKKEDNLLDAVRQPIPRMKLPAIPQTLPVAKPVNPSPTTCQRCGRGAHPCQFCPAKDTLTL